MKKVAFFFARYGKYITFAAQIRNDGQTYWDMV